MAATKTTASTAKAEKKGESAAPPADKNLSALTAAADGSGLLTGNDEPSAGAVPPPAAPDSTGSDSTAATAQVEPVTPLSAADYDPSLGMPFSVPPSLVSEVETNEAQHPIWTFYAQRCEAAVDVLKERCRQVEEEGYETERDDAFTDYQLPRAAVCYAIKAAGLPSHRATLYWPFAPAEFKPTDRRGSLVKAAALLLAEIERIDRAENVDD